MVWSDLESKFFVLSPLVNQIQILLSSNRHLLLNWLSNFELLHNLSHVGHCWTYWLIWISWLGWALGNTVKIIESKIVVSNTNLEISVLDIVYIIVRTKVRLGYHVPFHWSALGTFFKAIEILLIASNAGKVNFCWVDLLYQITLNSKVVN